MRDMTNQCNDSHHSDGHHIDRYNIDRYNIDGWANDDGRIR